jgi:ketosteroid isomerase-like protein
MKKWISLLIFFALVHTAQAQDEAQIKQVLEQQRQAWNRGDLLNYMQGYWNSDSLLFVGKNGPKYGWQQTLQNYQRSYPSKEAMGFLTFDIKEVRLIDAQHAFVLGAWHLKREKDEPKGFFTLLFRKISGQWYVVVDHSS